ncbi:hypothetical protein WN943_010674 [Citrus x changshan-huyou]
MRCKGSIEATNQFHSLACGPCPVVYSYSKCQHGSVDAHFYGISSSVIESKFVIDVHDPIIRNYFLDKLAMRFKNFRHQLKKEFEQYPIVEEAKRNPP